nr:cytochrome P450 71B34-like [Tanacetum cinerariifolium]
MNIKTIRQARSHSHGAHGNLSSMASYKNDIHEDGGERDAKNAPTSQLLIPHESISHYQIDSYDIFPKTGTLINAWGIDRDPNIWGKNADEFYPERFDTLEVDFGMIAFGGGEDHAQG